MAPSFAVLFGATLIIGVANGLVEAFVNPLVATLFSERKTTKLVALHAWFPGGIVVGGLLAYGFTQVGLGWQAKMVLLLMPSVVYTTMFWRETFPLTESTAAGVSLAGMLAEVRRPLFLLVWFCMPRLSWVPGNGLPTYLMKCLRAAPRPGLFSWCG